MRQLPVWPRDARPTPDETAPVARHIEPDGQYGLPLAEAPPVEAPAAAKRPDRLWFAIYLPSLPLEAVAVPGRQCAVVEEQQGVHRVLLADPAAAAAGVQPGLSGNAALALVPTLHLAARSEIHEQQTLEALASWLERFSSMVSIAGRDLLLLEIAASLKLFGGLRALRRLLIEGLRERGFDASVAIAPTPLASTWLARAGRRACVRDHDNIGRSIRPLPLSCLAWPPATCDALHGVGVRKVGDCLRLPRDGFARRFGAVRLLELDRALGHLPDPRDAWRSPERFVADFEMTEEQEDRELLLAICEDLLKTHERFLLERQLGTQRLRFSFYHLKAPATELRLGGAALSRSAAHWFELLRIRFEGLVLPEPVIAVRLRGGRAGPLQTETAGLRFDPGMRDGPRYSIAQLAERLMARVGRQSVCGVDVRHDHRPQFAAREVELDDPSVIGSLSTSWIEGLQRPLWMLSEPRPLAVEAGVPVYRGRLKRLSGPERVETGWWDGQGVKRDYYLAVNPAGLRLWIYRERRQDGGWYLHGLFG